MNKQWIFSAVFFISDIIINILTAINVFPNMTVWNVALYATVAVTGFYPIFKHCPLDFSGKYKVYKILLLVIWGISIFFPFFVNGAM